ncbi:DUF2637 domain-containing protein [Gulosibacter molinativorax]|uniref:Lipase chaperone n=1 Tax=Gulosibacter molinativorax TaxID=256821 RepID=A0ABT7CBY3_9MICO|nr:DUF2637 domain-containing protein [Gulosibacter molinativorax]MDJ1372710.1 lipase chaperone [Gulosibacter molinativorax]QUY61144.1 Excisionase [Gulosibacter molinativorax]
MNTAETVMPRGRQLAVVTAITGTVFIAAGAFWLSFTALADLARRSGIDARQAWAWPLIVDGIIVVATVAVVALASQHRPTWYPWTLLAAGAVVSVTANAIHAIIAADTDVPSVLAASVAAIPPLVLLAITHLTVMLTRPVAPITKANETVPDLAPVVRAVATTGDAVPGLEDAPTSKPPVPVVPVSERREEAAQLREVEGWSNKQIARHLGVHPSTVGRWFGAEVKEETS